MTVLFEGTSTDLEVWFESNVLKEIREYAIDADGSETGGVLAGYYPRSDALTISKVMEPTADSDHGATTFKRGTEGAQEWLQEQEENSMNYVGEWHTHPSQSPTPSDIDRETLVEIATDEGYGCPNPVQVIVGGDEDSGFETSVEVAFRDDRPLETFEEVPYP